MNLDDLISRCTNSPDERWDICAELYNALNTGGTEPIWILRPTFVVRFVLAGRGRPGTAVPARFGSFMAMAEEYQDLEMRPGYCSTFLDTFRAGSC